MIVLDTNVVSELVRDEPAWEVFTFIEQYPADEVHLTAVTAAELLRGVARLPDGRRKRKLAVEYDGLLNEDFAGQVLSFTVDAAVCYAEIATARERIGRPIGMADAQIAAICRLHGAELATRNVKDFADTGIGVLDPWSAPAARDER